MILTSKYDCGAFRQTTQHVVQALNRVADSVDGAHFSALEKQHPGPWFHSAWALRVWVPIMDSDHR